MVLTSKPNAHGFLVWPPLQDMRSYIIYYYTKKVNKLWEFRSYKEKENDRLPKKYN